MISIRVCLIKKFYLKYNEWYFLVDENSFEKYDKYQYY